MTPQMALELTHRALITAIQLCSPVLLTAMIVGILINIFQTVTSIKDQSLTFVPKLLAVAVALGLSMPWGIQLMSAYFRNIYQMLSGMAP